MNHSNLIVLAFAFILFSCSGNEYKTFISVNQTGYETDTPKIAYLVNSPDTGYYFELVNSQTHEVVFTDSIRVFRDPDPASGDVVGIIDFSEFNDSGSFILRMRDNHQVHSSPFSVGAKVYAGALETIIRSYYYHRCGVSVDLGDEWSYEICHLDDAPFYDNPEQRIDVTGGWHDAGDYNKFTVNTTLSASLLLYMYAENPDRFSDGQLGIPESGNGIPDVLDEISWALRWLLSMQRSDGALFHKVSQKRWIGEFLPHTDPSVRYLFEPSSAATASFAATAAIGARVMYPYNPNFAQELENAALKAWNYLILNPMNLPLGGFRNPPDVSGGEYGDTNDSDERLWAAIELYNLTSERQYLDFFINHLNRIQLRPVHPISWRNAHSLALHAFYFSDTDGLFSQSKEDVKTALIRHADQLLDTHKRNNYDNLLKHTEYYWGSNSVGLAYAHDLVQAWKITGNTAYREAALDQLHFVMGRNPLNLSQITGVGYRAVRNPYHQLSKVGNFSNPVPGMLVGGPNNYVFLNDREISPYPAKNFEDAFRNYFVSEPAINFTAILAWVMSSLSDYSKPYSVQETL
ncbi:MAG: glycoside hydrolase family 9 protein [Balneolia bacterium]|nr:glycoside hydrolase family 9 protein [Balneolia bacterium]